MTKIVAFEGVIDSEFHATWGTAALQVGEEIVNPTTGLRAPISSLDELVAEGALFRFSSAIPVEDGHDSDPLLIIAVNDSSEFKSTLMVDAGKHGGILKRAKRDGAICYVARNSDALEIYSRDISRRILAKVLEAKRSSRAAMAHVGAGLSIDPSHPYLNALRVFLTEGESSSAQEFALACTRGAKGREAFEEFLHALRSGGERHVLSYREGITAGGGLDAQYVAKIFGSLKTLIEELRKEVREFFPFLPIPSYPRLADMTPGSANFGFAADVEDSTLGERVARFLELRALERALQGEQPGEHVDELRFERALEILAHPAPETSLYQKPLFKDQEEPVFIDSMPEGTTHDEDLRVLGFVTGVLSEAAKLEVRIFPGIRGRLLLSLDDDGFGEPPAGTHDFTRGNRIQFYRPVILNLLRRTDEQDRERIFLKKLSQLGAPSVAINALPSSVISGSFRLIQDVRPELAGDILRLASHVIDLPLLPSRSAMHEWLVAFKVVSQELELIEPRMEWTRAIRTTRPSSLARVLVSVYALGGSAVASDVAEEVSRRFGQIARVNNTRREAIRHPEYLRVDEDNKKILHLTTNGKLFVKAYMKASGDIGEGRLPSEDSLSVIAAEDYSYRVGPDT